MSNHESKHSLLMLFLMVYVSREECRIFFFLKVTLLQLFNYFCSPHTVPYVCDTKIVCIFTFRQSYNLVFFLAFVGAQCQEDMEETSWLREKLWYTYQDRELLE